MNNKKAPSTSEYLIIEKAISDFEIDMMKFVELISRLNKDEYNKLLKKCESLTQNINFLQSSIEFYCEARQ